MSRLLIGEFRAPGVGNQAGSLVKFYANSNGTTPVAVYPSVTSGTAVFPRADSEGVISADLYVDSSVTTLYARTENPGGTPSSTVQVLYGSVEPISQATSISLIDCGNAA